MIKLCIVAGLHFDEHHSNGSNGTDFVTYNNKINKKDLRQGYKKVTIYNY